MFDHLRTASGLLALLVVTVWPASASAQHDPFTPGDGDQRIPVTIIATNDGMPPTLLRRASEEPLNVVLVDSATIDAEQLSLALGALIKAEWVDPTGLDRHDNRATRSSSADPPPPFPWADQVLCRLERAPVRPIAIFGERRAIDIWIPIWSAPARPGKSSSTQPGPPSR